MKINNRYLPQHSPLRMITSVECDMNDEWGSLLICPVCEYEYVHIGHRIKRGKFYGKNGCLYIPMFCENDHFWDLIIDEHKGNAYMTVSIYEPIDLEHTADKAAEEIFG